MAGLAVEYLVKFNSAAGRWDVFRGGRPTGAFARDVNTAIGTALNEASLESRITDLEVTVLLEEPGKRARQVWP